MKHTCDKCKLIVDTDEEPYVRITDMEGKQRWWHKKTCWNVNQVQQELAVKAVYMKEGV